MACVQHGWPAESVCSAGLPALESLAVDLVHTAQDVFTQPCTEEERQAHPYWSAVESRPLNGGKQCIRSISDRNTTADLVRWPDVYRPPQFGNTSPACNEFRMHGVC